MLSYILCDVSLQNIVTCCLRCDVIEWMQTTSYDCLCCDAVEQVKRTGYFAVCAVMLCRVSGTDRLLYCVCCDVAERMGREIEQATALLVL